MSFRGKTIHGDVCPSLSSPRCSSDQKAMQSCESPKALISFQIHSLIVVLLFRGIEELRLESTSTGILPQLPCPKKGQLQQADQNHAQPGFKFLQRQRLHNLSRLPVSDHFTIRAFFLIFNQNFLYFSLCSLPLVFLLDAKFHSDGP